MKVLELAVTDSAQGELRPRRGAEASVPVTRLAPALTIAAAIGGVAEVLLERVAGPALTHAAGPGMAPVGAIVSAAGTIAVAVTAVLVALAAVAWAGVAWDRHRIVAAAILAATAIAFAAAFSGHAPLVVLLHVSVTVAAIGTVLAWRSRDLDGIAIAALAIAIVAGQWSLAGWSGELTVTTRVVAEAALVVALILLAVSRPLDRRSAIGAAAGAAIAAAALMSPRTPLIALWASGATLWMPSIVYIVAGGAVGLLLVTWLPDRSTRHLAAGLALLAVAGIEPALLHHNLTALVALLALSVAPEGSAQWR